MARTVGTGMRLPETELGSVIRRVRMALLLSQAQFAAELGAEGHSMVANWESGRVVPCGLYLYGMATLAVVDEDRQALLSAAGTRSDGMAVLMVASRLAAQGVV